MSGVRTSSLSLPSSLRNWVILDYEEANGLTIRPWAPVFSHILSSYPPSPSSRSRSATPSVPLHGPCRRRWGKEWCGRNCRSYHLQSHHIAGFSGSLLSPPYSRLSPLASLGPWFTARHARSVAHLSTFASRPHPFAFLIPFTYHLFSHSVGQRPVPPERNGMGRGEWNAKGMGMLGLVQLGLLSFFPRSRRLTAQHSHSPHSLTSLVSWGTVGHYVPFRSFPETNEVTSETRERETEGKRPAVPRPFVSHGRSLAHASLAPSVVPLRNEWSREAAVSDMSRRRTDPPIPLAWLEPHLDDPKIGNRNANERPHAGSKESYHPSFL